MQAHIQPPPSRMNPHPSVWDQQRTSLLNTIAQDCLDFAGQRSVDDFIPIFIPVTMFSQENTPFYDLLEQGSPTKLGLALIKQLPCTNPRASLP